MSRLYIARTSGKKSLLSVGTCIRAIRNKSAFYLWNTNEAYLFESYNVGHLRVNELIELKLFN